jgi:hypothetical protein
VKTGFPRLTVIIDPSGAPERRQDDVSSTGAENNQLDDPLHGIGKIPLRLIDGPRRHVFVDNKRHPAFGKDLLQLAEYLFSFVQGHHFSDPFTPRINPILKFR